MRVLGINAVFHDPSAALVVDGRIVAAAEEERFSRRKHGKPCVPFSTWELPVEAARWCLEFGETKPSELDAIAYSYDPDIAFDTGADLAALEYEGLRTFYVRRAPGFLATAFPGYAAERTRFVGHHLSHAASAYLAGPFRTCSVLVLDGRGERTSYLAGRAVDGTFQELERQELPHSLGLRYEDVTVHVGFARSSDEYKVMALASYGSPRFLPALRGAIKTTERGFAAAPIDFSAFAPARREGEPLLSEHADLAASVQARLQEILLELATRLHARTGDRALVMAGGVALNCVANSYLAERGPFEHVWVQPAAGDAGTALGAALYVAHQGGDRIEPMRSASLGRGWSDEEIRHELELATLRYERPPDIAEAVAELLASDEIVAWFEGRSEFGPRALGNRSLLAHPGYARNLSRLNDVKGREQFRPVAPMVLASRAREIFDGPFPSPYMLFTHRVRERWAPRLPTVTHVDGSARVQTVEDESSPIGRMLLAFERRTGIPVVVNTSFNTAGRPMVDDPRDALECFGSAPIGALCAGPYLLSRNGQHAMPA
jgi:carbamoyltransferase